MPLASAYPAVAIPPVSLTQHVFEGMAARGAQPAYIDSATGERISFAELAALVPRVARGLMAQGIGPGDRVGLLGPNGIAYAVAFHALAAAGAASAPMNGLSTPTEVAHYLRTAGARMLLVAPALLPVAREALAQLPGVRLMVLGPATDAAADAPALLALAEGQPAEWPAVAIDPAEHVVTLPFSSGTTGLPKGVMLTHRNLVAECVLASGVTDASLMEPGETIVAVLPFFHIYGIICFLNQNLRLGVTVVIMPRFDLERYLQLVVEHGVTFLHVVPPILLALAKHPIVAKYDLSRVRGALSAAAPLGTELAAAFTARLGVPIAQAYGMTELSGASHLGPMVPGRNKPASAGQLMPGLEARVMDLATDREVGVGEQGEIQVRGPVVMKGYIGNEAATRATIDQGGWLHTGDVGHVDADGDFWIVDRVKELIKYKGLQVAPAELEGVLIEHPQVADVAVIPLPDPEAGEIPKAYVVRKPGADLDADAVMAYVAERVAPQKRVRAVEFVEQIPRSASGKILRRLLVERERQRAG